MSDALQVLRNDKARSREGNLEGGKRKGSVVQKMSTRVSANGYMPDGFPLERIDSAWVAQDAGLA